MSRRRQSRQPSQAQPSGPHPGDILDLVALSPDGLALNSDGALVQLIEVGRPVNTLVMDEDAMRDVSRKLDKVASHLPAHEDLHLYMHASPLAIDDVVADEFAHSLRAVRRAQASGDEDLAVALDRVHAAEEHSLRTHSRAVAAKELRHIVVCPLRPQRGGLLGRRGPSARRGGPLRFTPTELARAREAAFDHVEGILGQLKMAELPGRLLDGFAVLDLLWERMSPNAADDRQPPPSVTQPGVLRELDAAATPQQAAEFTAQLRAAICQEPIDFSQRSHITFGKDDSRSVVQSIYLTGLPDETWLGWLLYLMRAGIPFSLSVHVQATDRYREKLRNIRRYKRLRGLNRGALRSGRDVEADAQDKEDEAGFLVRHLFRRAGAGIYRVSITLTLREPNGDVDALQAQTKAVMRDMLSDMDARMSSGLFAQHALLRTSLPLGHDEADRRKRMTSINVGDTFPLVGTGCGSPTGLPLGYAQPGRTLERLDPYSADHQNHICVVNGRSGTGKTMTTQILLMRAIARGATGFVIDRAGHFSFLCGLIPGAVSLRVGADAHAINPWDVADVANVPRKKVAYLVALHAQLIGSVDSSDTFGLDALERSQLSVAIREVYKRCQLTHEVPRERILQEVLYQRADDERDAGAHDIAAVLRSLAERLHDFVGEGAYAYLTDSPTSIPEHAPLMAFDTKDIPNEVVPAALFIVAEAVVRRVEARREAHLASGGAAGDWNARTFLVLDEAWKLVERPATGRIVMEWGLRSRHLALWVIAITQQMQHLDNEYGRALLDNASIRIFLNQYEKELRYVQDALAISDEAIKCIKALTTDKRRYSNAYLMNGAHGQGTVTIQVGDYEYWATTSDPDNDEPVRRAALRQAHAERGELDYHTYWRALQLLADPDWHAAQQPRRGARQLARAA